MKRAMRIVWVFLALVLAVAFPVAWAQQEGDRASPPTVDAIPLPIDRGAVALWQSLRRLETRASLVLIAAHPDDEDGGMLTYESRGLGTRVALLTLNRGEGGQNVMSDDYWD